MTEGLEPGKGAEDTLDLERWRQIDALFTAALERDSKEWPSFLESECGDDQELRLTVANLLEHHSRADEFLETPVFVSVAFGERKDPNSERAAAGDVIGPYRIEREIGRGGMGSVYLAHRADDAYRRQVAIKMLDRASESMVKRFLSERQILASLDHPHVARLFEGGESPTGRPYLVMEYVDGVPIDHYCDLHGLDVDQRLALFCKVCSAVHYAHQNLIVHRDIKPSNVLVKADGEPRLLDFGIAKLLDPEAFPLTLDRTATDMRPMTPHYASPEQIRGDVITTASDVYSLGVLLYKLLTGRLPHSLTGLPVREVERLLIEEVPIKASIAVTLPAGEARRGGRPQQLARRLAGDLDNIVAMALRREPERRYGSAEQLAQDLERHLTGQPVMARQDTFGYRMSIFLRRNKMAVAVAGLVVAMIVAFAWSSARQRDRAQLERDKAKQVSAFLVDLFREVDPSQTPGSRLTVREVLDRGAIKVEQELQDQPEVRATLQEAIGTVYMNLGLYDQASPHLETALDTMRDQLGEGHSDVAGAAAKVANLYRRQAKYEDAERLYLRALEIFLRSPAAEDEVDASRVHSDLANLYRVKGRFAEAQEQAERALTILESALGPEHPKIVQPLMALAGITFRQGDLAASIDYTTRALNLQRETVGELDLQTAAIYANLGVLRLNTGANAEAEPLFNQSLALHLRLLEEPHQRIGGVLVSLGNLAKAQNNNDLAEQYLRRALDNYERSVGRDHDLVANCLYHLGLVVVLQGRPDEAERLLQRSLAIRERVFPPDHHFVAEGLRGLGELHAGQGQHAEAERLYLRALGIWEKYPRQQGTQGVPESYVALLRAMGRAEEAAWLEQRASKLQKPADSSPD